MAVVVSVSVPAALHNKWKQSGLDISPSQLFQTALVAELDKKNQALVYWSSRALEAEKKLKLIKNLLVADKRSVKKFLLFENES